MAQWIKNPTIAARVDTEARVQSLPCELAYNVGAPLKQTNKQNNPPTPNKTSKQQQNSCLEMLLDKT